MDGLCLKTRFHVISPAIMAPPSQMSPPSSRFHFGYSLKSLWAGGGDDEKRGDELQSKDVVSVESRDTKGEESKWKWVLKILQRNVSGDADCGNGDEECDVCSVDDEDGDEEIEFDRESFSRMLRKVSLSETKLCAQLSYLGNLAYSISKIKAGKLWKFHRLRFVTSSFEKRQVASKAGNYHTTKENQEAEGDIEKKGGQNEPQCSGHEGSVSAAYHMAASAAGYLQSRTNDLLSSKSFKPEYDEGSDCTGGSGQVDEMMNSDTASLTAAKSTMTAVVAAEEEARRDVADDLNSILSSPCQWFICDDERSSTRFFVIQGSESLASWQANLLFEPTQFEGMDVLVHRGIYDAAKVMYAQMLPEVSAHLQAHGRHALFRFTGHSLGGSLSLLISLMLLIRGAVPFSGLLPVITYGSPSIMCGGDRLLHELGLPRSHVWAIILHRDIVPRVFACHYPSRLSGLLKAVKGNFRNHPCLNNQELLYSPMGELLILQPDEKFSPQHHLLPCGCGLYLLSCPWSPFQTCWKQLVAAERLFLNSPHPLEILCERTAYGSEGSIHRDHDMKSYLGSLRGVIRVEQKSRREDRRERIHKVWWYLALQVGIHASIMLVRSVASLSMGQERLQPNWNESLRRCCQVVMHMLLLMVYPVKLVALKVCSVISFH